MMTIEELNLKGLLALSKWGLPSKPCDSCTTSPALLFCLPHSASLCASCHRNNHSATTKTSYYDTWTTDFKPLELLQSDVDSLLDLGSPNHSDRIYGADSVVPIDQTTNNYARGKCFEVDFAQAKVFPLDFSAQCISQSVSSSEVGVVPDESSNWMAEVSNFQFLKPSTSTQALAALPGMDRAARVMRYREKRKNRKFEKMIRYRYASRKAYAETRPRIKGRFAKRNGEVEQTVYSAGAGGFAVDDHGVVPLF